VAPLITGLDPDRVRANLAEARAAVDAAAATAGRRPGEVEILAAAKYVPSEELGRLGEAGITLMGENRAQDLEVKAADHPGRFTWDFIGALQSRKVRSIAPHVRIIHSVASDSALEQLRRHAHPGLELLVQVNIAEEPGKAGIDPAALDAFIERCPFRPSGLMIMPPAAERPEDSRRWFSGAREMAERHGLARLSMGTSQDYVVAVEEGATIVRLGQILYS
jgi:pyridoxal phosphate enzyme (YggS family)